MTNKISVFFKITGRFGLVQFYSGIPIINIIFTQNWMRFPIVSCNLTSSNNVPKLRFRSVEWTNFDILARACFLINILRQLSSHKVCTWLCPVHRNPFIVLQARTRILTPFAQNDHADQLAHIDAYTEWRSAWTLKISTEIDELKLAPGGSNEGRGVANPKNWLIRPGAKVAGEAHCGSSEPFRSSPYVKEIPSE